MATERGSEHSQNGPPATDSSAEDAGSYAAVDPLPNGLAGCTVDESSTDPNYGSDSTSLTPQRGKFFSKLQSWGVNVDMISCKAFYLFFSAGIGSVLPYLVIYFKQLGLSPEQIGLISGMRPVVGFMSGPFWGSLGDRYRTRRFLLLMSVTAWTVFFVALAFIKPAERSNTCPVALNSTVHERLLAAAAAAAAHNYSNLTTTPLTLANVADATQLARLSKKSIGWVYDHDDLMRVFATVLVLIVSGEFVQSSTTSLADAGALDTLGIEGRDKYGHSRAWGPIGWSIGSMSVGALLTASRHKEVICQVELYFSDYSVYLYVFVVFMVLTFVASATIKFKYGPPDNMENIAITEVGKEPVATPHESNIMIVLRTFANVHYGSWILTIFFFGICNGLIWGFLFWHLENLGATHLLMGVASLAACTSEFIMFFFVGHALRLIGHMGLVYTGLASYLLRFVAYGAITNPWWVIPAEFLQGITFSCVWGSMIMYAAESVPASSMATIQGLMHGIYFGLGNGLGHLLGGVLIGAFGAPASFYSFAVACAVVSCVFFIAQKMSEKPEYKNFT